MNIFSELYGAYFRTAKKALCEEKLTEKDVNRIISENAFRDSMLFIPEKLIPQKDGFSPWGLLRRGADGTLSSVLSHKPASIVTELQKRWLKAKLSDPRIHLFMDDSELEALSSRLENVRPLYDPACFRCFDRHSDGDDYSGEFYRKAFREILSAVKAHEILSISFISKNGARSGEFLPLKIEYSRKNDKFRALCLRISGGKRCGTGIINIGRINGVSRTEKTYNGSTDMDEYFSERRCREPVTVEIGSERNGVERFMMEFSAYEKRSELDLETGKCVAQIWYDESDETELLIRLLSFGPVLKIIGPADFRAKAAERVERQYELLFGEADISE